MGPVWSTTRSLEPATWFTSGRACWVGIHPMASTFKVLMLSKFYTTLYNPFQWKISRMAYFLCFRFLHMIFFCLGVSCVFMTFCPHFCWIIFISRTFKQQCQVWCLLSKVSTDFIPVIMLWLEWVNGLVCGRRTVSNLRTMVFRGYIIYRTCCMGLQANW